MQTIMSYWTFSDVFEEQGVPKTPFYGGFGVLAAGGIPKPAFHAFQLLHRLGTQRIPLETPWILATRRDDGTLVIAAWNYSAPEDPGKPMNARIQFRGAHAGQARITTIGPLQGSPRPAWEAMGKPASPTREQIVQLQRAAQLPAAETRPITGNGLDLTLPPHGLALIEIGRP
jgi:xylan 1,4-beta-xylosidase